MTQSFGVVEEKLLEAEFFLEHLRKSPPLSFDCRFFFSAFVSSARSVTLALQATMKGTPGFDDWYQPASASLKASSLVRHFKEIRNDSIHKGLNPLNRVTIKHLREHMAAQLSSRDAHVIVLPSVQESGSSALVDAISATEEYFASLVAIIYECYDQFKMIVDPRWYFTNEAFQAKGKTFEDAIAELGFPPAWATCAPKGDEGWRILRRQHPPCQLNDLFGEYLGRRITDPDNVD